MSRIVLILSSKPNRRLMEEALADRYIAVVSEGTRAQEPLRVGDLIVVDGVMLERYMDAIVQAKQDVLPVFLPVLLVTSRQNVGLATRNLWKSIDEVILTPIERVELQARLEVMLRARQLSMQLFQRNQDMEAFVNAVTHELRAPLRAIAGFAQALAEDTLLPREGEAAAYLRRITESAQEMKRILDALLTFLRLGSELQVQTVWLQPLFVSCLKALEQEIAEAKAQVEYELQCDAVEADPLLLKLAVGNLLSNALKFRYKDRNLHIALRVYPRGDYCRIEVQDNGIGMSAEDIDRVFTPFTRLHGVEDYPGIGLGLSVVRKAVTLMTGRCGAVSRLGEGSIFWIELPLVAGGGQEQ